LRLREKKRTLQGEKIKITFFKISKCLHILQLTSIHAAQKIDEHVYDIQKRVLLGFRKQAKKKIAAVLTPVFPGRL